MGTQKMSSLDLKSHALIRQSSLYNLTLDEVQHQLGDLGKPISSMNLDELLKSVWSAEPNKDVVFAPGSASLSLDLSKKTVDEVWRDIQKGKNGNKRVVRERESTLGEMTLEDFLAKAGVVSQYSPPQETQWINYQQDQIGNMVSLYMPGQQIVEIVYPEQQMSLSPSAVIGALSDTATPGRKRVASGDVVEKIVERRHKRMIKNRESAARSRARKEAYTHELENKVSRLEEENERLKRRKEVEKLLPLSTPEPKYQLRRTSSAPLC